MLLPQENRLGTLKSYLLNCVLNCKGNCPNVSSQLYANQVG